jgi:hypothetical protein
MAHTEMNRIIYVPFDHLHRNFGALKDADPASDLPELKVRAQEVLKGLDEGRI